jgi:S1-C subfamily serine protease
MSLPSPRKKSSGSVLYVVVGLIAALTSVGIYTGAQYWYQTRSHRTGGGLLDNPASAETKNENSGNGEAGTAALKKTSESFRTVAKKVGPAVVNIKSTKGVKKSKKLRNSFLSTER